jgi:hypothetical protein
MKKFVLLLLIFSASAAYGEIYTWKDARGTAFYTNSLNEIPARYLKKARVLDVATGKKGALATAQQPTAQSGPATPGQAPGQIPGQAPAQQTPTRYPVATPVPVVAPSVTPTVMTPTPPSIPPAASVSAPQQQSRGSRTERRTQRRRDYSAPEEE